MLSYVKFGYVMPDHTAVQLVPANVFQAYRNIIAGLNANNMHEVQV